VRERERERERQTERQRQRDRDRGGQTDMGKTKHVELCLGNFMVGKGIKIRDVDMRIILK
jgi:hypothetical protein